MRIFGGPGRYMQGPDALDQLPGALDKLGSRPLVVVDADVDRLIGSRLSALLSSVSGQARKTLFSGEVTYAVIDDLAKLAAEHRADVVVGMGGGKAIDAAKGAANRCDTRLVTVPTIASNDAPTAKVMAIYDNDHVLVAIDRDGRSPDLVIVDTALIASAPARFLVAGIGDAIAKKFEAEGCVAGGGINSYGTRPLMAALALADACYRQIRAYATSALADLRAGVASDAVENVVEAVILMSGLGYENGGLSIAHSMTRGLVAPASTKGAAHGLHVAYALLVQLRLEGRDDAFMDDMIAFYRSIGLPVRLDDLGPDAAADLEAIARLSMGAPHIGNLSRPVSLDGMIDAMRSLEPAGRVAA